MQERKDREIFENRSADEIEDQGTESDAACNDNENLYRKIRCPSFRFHDASFLFSSPFKTML